MYILNRDIMKKMKIFAWTILLAAGLTACTDWLTVQPKTEVSKDDMFKSSGCSL